VTLLDANILSYAYDRSSPHNQAARVWLESSFSGREHIGLSWVTVLAFLRVSTSPRPLEQPLSITEAIPAVSGWVERPIVTILNPGERHWEILRELLTTGQVHGPLVMDAHLAALAIEHGATLATTDRDFTRFRDCAS
jgi:uncharacterized protein